jgi:hypothetical protein
LTFSLDICGLVFCGALSEERTGLQFVPRREFRRGSSELAASVRIIQFTPLLLPILLALPVWIFSSPHPHSDNENILCFPSLSSGTDNSEASVLTQTFQRNVLLLPHVFKAAVTHMQALGVNEWPSTRPLSSLPYCLATFSYHIARETDRDGH